MFGLEGTLNIVLAHCRNSYRYDIPYSSNRPVPPHFHNAWKCQKSRERPTHSFNSILVTFQPLREKKKWTFRETSVHALSRSEDTFTSLNDVFLLPSAYVSHQYCFQQDCGYPRHICPYNQCKYGIIILNKSPNEQCVSFRLSVV